MSSLTDQHPRRSALVVTVVHDPRDARIWFRQIHALLQAGWEVTYAAPFSEVADVSIDGLPPDQQSRLRLIDLPRAHARRRMTAAWNARRLLRAEGPRHDVVLVHDPELLLAGTGLDLPNLVWDVHEDPAAALGVKAWLPRPLRGPVAEGWRMVERVAEDRVAMILAERSYQERFRRKHPVVVNAVTVPPDHEPSTGDRVVHLGAVTTVRGGDLLPAIGRGIREATAGRVTLEVIGPSHELALRHHLRRAHEDGDLVWHGFLPSDQALARVSGSMAGLTLLNDVPNYHGSLPTKVVEYCALGVPVITTPLPLAAELVRQHGVGVVVPFADPTSVVEQVVALAADPERVATMGRRGHRLAQEHHDWNHWSSVFVHQLEGFARRFPAPRRSQLELTDAGR
ncbi:glycosyltransferase [Auraticoccus sp. F435]|uniref:Glycosyltransferase n=1 Tax=Auraticoccus cholistanensis TaxID=2656650 RepID=A0A6A9V2K7_9ACTN|nr:glycosyltransferase [Auraticoccus cholistanensis]MVA77761.1 glycosyltransferase [Auraticoccus cholistanensis]